MPIASATGLARLIEAEALIAEFPTVITTTDSVFFHLSEKEARAPVGTTGVQQPRLIALIAKQDEILSQAANQLGKCRGLRCERNRLPVAAQQFPARSARTNLSKHRI